VLKLKSGVTADEVRLTRDGDGLVLSIEGTEDSITASNFSLGMTRISDLTRCKRYVLQMVVAGIWLRC